MAAIDAPDPWRVTARSTAHWGLDEGLPLDQNRPAMQLAFVSAAKIAATLTPAPGWPDGVIMITGTGDHLRPEWPITITGMRNLVRWRQIGQSHRP